MAITEAELTALMQNMKEHLNGMDFVMVHQMIQAMRGKKKR